MSVRDRRCWALVSIFVAVGVALVSWLAVITPSQAAAPLSVRPSLPEAPIAAAYKASLGHQGGRGTVTFKVVSGSLPPGITMSVAGVFSGAPTTLGGYTFSVTAFDTASPANAATAELEITVVPMSITTSSLPDAPIAAAYKASLGHQGGRGTVTFKVGSGSLPPGITMSGAGVFSGAPTKLGTYTFSVAAFDTSSPANVASSDLQITVVPMSISIN